MCVCLFVCMRGRERGNRENEPREQGGGNSVDV